MSENLTLVRRSASGQRILYWSLGIAVVVGLAAHVGGFLLKSSATTVPTRRPWAIRPEPEVPRTPDPVTAQDA